MRRAEDLLDELYKEGNISNYLKKNERIFLNNDISLQEFWQSACEKSKMSKSNIINVSKFSYCYFYDVINGRKIPSKDKIIRLCLTMKLSLYECQNALILSGKAPLYPTIKRDSIIIYSIIHGLSVEKCCELLEVHNQQILK